MPVSSTWLKLSAQHAHRQLNIPMDRKPRAQSLWTMPATQWTECTHQGFCQSSAGFNCTPGPSLSLAEDQRPPRGKDTAQQCQGLHGAHRVQGPRANLWPSTSGQTTVVWYTPGSDQSKRHPMALCTLGSEQPERYALRPWSLGPWWGGRGRPLQWGIPHTMKEQKLHISRQVFLRQDVFPKNKTRQTAQSEQPYLCRY